MKFYLVDCFTDKKYQGNQLAIFVLNRPVSEEEMQKIANEIGFSETSFILSGKQPNGGYDVRIFTPDTEVPFAGHPTLGTSYVIQKYIEDDKSQEIRLNLKVGQISVVVDESGLTMTQNQPEFGEEIDKSAVAAALSIDPSDVQGNYPVQMVSTGLEAVIVPLTSIEALERCCVNHDNLQAFHKAYYQCNVLVFVPSDTGIRARVFLDDYGFLEDPATGSANGDLAAYLLHHNFFNADKLSYTVSQGIEMGRPSIISINVSIVDEVYAIHVGGHAHIVASGDWI